MKYAFLSAIFSMCTLETTKDTTIEGSDEWPRQPIMEGEILCIRGKNPFKTGIKIHFSESK